MFTKYKINIKSSIIAIIVVVFIAMFFIYRKSYLYPENNKQKVNKKTVEVQKITTTDLKQTVHLLGTVKAKYSTTFTAQITGTLNLFFQAGQKIHKGTIVASIDNADIEKNYALAKTDEEISRSQYEREQQLLKSNYSKQSNIEELKKKWIASQQSLITAKTEFDKTKFYAPFDGIISILKVPQGTLLQKDDKILNFYDPSNIIVEFYIPVTIINFINNGQAIQIDGKDYKLSHVQKVIDEETHMCPAYVDISPQDHIIGTIVDVDLTVQQKKDIIAIPFEAIIIRNNQTFVYIVKDEKATLVPVELGIQEKDQVEIVSGLQLDDNIIVTGKTRLYPNMPVTIYNSK